ncbi:MAG TPA: AAA family ATPase [Candidatus Saccharimonadales bacterium]|nr:AAA family ATPase [Candidatus Saccharimonadales bacterium]
MDKLVLHPSTKKTIDLAIGSVSQAIVLVGPKGLGKKSLAKYITSRLLDSIAVDQHPNVYFVRILPDKKNISIDEVRKLNSFLALKVASSSQTNRAVIIEDAQTMTAEAQNAILKLIEEPPSGTVFILTVTHEQDLLPTILSRVQQIRVAKPTKAELLKAVKQSDEEHFNSLYSISDGKPGLLFSLLNDTGHPFAEALEVTRNLITQPVYQRLLLMESLSKDKQRLSAVISLLLQMAHAGLRSGKNTDRWQKIYQTSYEAKGNLEANAQTKLVVLQLMLNL